MNTSIKESALIYVLYIHVHIYTFRNTLYMKYSMLQLIVHFDTYMHIMYRILEHTLDN